MEGDELFPFTKLIEFDDNGHLTYNKTNLEEIFKFWGKKHCDLVHLLAFTGGSKSGKTFLTNLLIQHLESGGKSCLHPPQHYHPQITEIVKLCSFSWSSANKRALTLCDNGMENNSCGAGIYIWPRPFRFKNRNSNATQLEFWILQVVSNIGNGNQDVLEQFLLLVCSHLLEIKCEDSKFRLMDNMEQLVKGGINMDQLTDNITYILPTKKNTTTRTKQNIIKQAVDIHFEIMCGFSSNLKSEQILVRTSLKNNANALWLNESSLRMYDSNGMLNAEAGAVAGRHLNDMMKLLTEKMLRYTKIQFGEKCISAKFDSAVNVLNKMGFKRQWLRYISETERDSGHQSLSLTKANKRRNKNKLNRTVISLTKQKRYSSRQMKTNVGRNFNQSLRLESNCAKNERRKTEEWNHNSFKSLIKNLISAKIEEDLTLYNPCETLISCYKMAVNRMQLPIPSPMEKYYQEWVQKTASSIDAYILAIRRYYEHHYVCFADHTKLKKFCLREQNDILASVSSSVELSKESMTIDVLKRACNKITAIFENDDREISKIEMGLATKLSGKVRNFYNKEMGRFINENCKGYYHPERLIEINERILTRCLVLFETRMSSDGKDNCFITEIGTKLKNYLLQDFLIFQQANLKLWSNSIENTFVVNNEIETTAGDEGNEDTPVTILPQQIQLFNSTLFIRITMDYLTLGRISSNGVPELIQNEWNENHTLALIGQDSMDQTLYGKAVQIAVHLDKKAHFIHWSLRKVLLTSKTVVTPPRTFEKDKVRMTLDLFFGLLLQRLKENAERTRSRKFQMAIIIVPFWINVAQRAQLEMGAKSHCKFEIVKFVDENICVARSYLQSDEGLKYQVAILVLSENSGYIDIGVHQCHKNGKLPVLVDKRLVPCDSNGVALKSLVRYLISLFNFWSTVDVVLRSLESVKPFLKTFFPKHKQILSGAVIACTDEKHFKFLKKITEKYLSNIYPFRDANLEILVGATLCVQDLLADDQQFLESTKFLKENSDDLQGQQESNFNTDSECTNKSCKEQEGDSKTPRSNLVKVKDGGASTTGLEVLNSRKDQLKEECKCLCNVINATRIKSQLYKNVSLKKVDTALELVSSENSELQEIEKMIAAMKKLKAQF